MQSVVVIIAPHKCIFSVKRQPSKTVAMQDLDIDFRLMLNAATYDRLMAQIQSDCALLEALRVMDYSMLLGVHYLSWGPEEWHPPKIKVSA